MSLGLYLAMQSLGKHGASTYSASGTMLGCRVCGNVFPSSETRVSGNYCVNIKVANYRFKLHHWCRQEYLGGPARAVGGKTTLLGIMDDPWGILCT